MAGFQYTALDADGRSVSGVLQADSPRHARTQLRAQGLFPSAVDEVRGPHGAGLRWRRKLPNAELSHLTSQLAALLASGLTLEQSLNALMEQASDPRTNELLSGIREELVAGHSLAAALDRYPGTFPGYYRALVRGGEDSGALPLVLQELSEHLESSHEFQQKTRLALLYPLLVSVVALAIVGGLLTYVVPQLVEVFRHSRQQLPLLTRALIGFSDFARAAWPYIVVAGVGAALATRNLWQRPGPRRRMDAWLLHLPYAGALIVEMNTARFAGTLAILLRGGVPLLRALESARESVTNGVLKQAIEQTIERVRQGESLARALGATQSFPPVLVHMIASGETSGRLEQMLERAGRLQRRALERGLAVFLTLLEPLMILFMGGLVLLIVLAILLPIIELNQLVR
jgi:general secretion pathway protein F